MNILHLEASKGWGGQEIRILREAEGMRAQGHTVIFAVTRGGGLVAKARALGFTVYEVHFAKKAWVWTLFRLLRILRKHAIHLVNTHSSLDSWIGGIAARLMRKPIVRTRHLSTPIKQGLNSRLLYKTLADSVVTTCASIVPMIVAQSGQNSTRCRSIPTGVDPEAIQVNPREVHLFREKWNLSPQDFVVGTACFMRSWKGIDDLLQAANLLRDVPNLKWMVIGGGHAERHHKLAQELDLKSQVFFTGHLDPPFAAIAALDAFALLSTAHEGVSQAILQAAYLRKPLIATPIGGLQEVCIHGKTGLIVPPFSPSQIANSVLQLKQNQKLASQFGRAAHQLVLDRFTFSHTLQGMKEVYSELF